MRIDAHSLGVSQLDTQALLLPALEIKMPLMFYYVKLSNLERTRKISICCADARLKAFMFLSTCPDGKVWTLKSNSSLFLAGYFERDSKGLMIVVLLNPP